MMFLLSHFSMRNVVVENPIPGAIVPYIVRKVDMNKDIIKIKVTTF